MITWGAGVEVGAVAPAATGGGEVQEWGASEMDPPPAEERQTSGNRLKVNSRPQHLFVRVDTVFYGSLSQRSHLLKHWVNSTSVNLQI